MVLSAVTLVAAAGFYFSEKRAIDPILPLKFFRRRGFSTGNIAVFLCSFSIFSMFAFAPLFVQGALGKSPMQVGMAMLSLSLGWSLGSVILGQISNRIGIKRAAVTGALMLIAGCGATLGFDVQTSMLNCFLTFQLVGLGMGFVTLATLIVVQNSVDISDLGVATSSNQFARTLGGTVGVGICGSFMTASLSLAIDRLKQSGTLDGIAETVSGVTGKSLDALLQPEVQNRLTEEARVALREAISSSVSTVFWIALSAAVLCLLLCIMLPKSRE
jgi:MFS family permease